MALAARAPRAADELAARLAQLGSASAAERLSAQRWLATNATVADLPALARAATGNVEVRERLVEALGASDQGLDLAALAAADFDPGLAAVGRDALAEIVARWSPGFDRRGATAAEVATDLGKQRGRILVERGEGGLAETLDRLARATGEDPALVLDPGLDLEVRRVTPDRAAGARPLRGAREELLLALAERDRVELEGFGFGRTRSADAWVRVCKRGDAGRETGAELLARWCTEVVRERGQPLAAASARALAASGWPAAAAWLERRWLRDGDPAALSGLVVAAGRGRVVPALFDAGVQRRLYAEAERALGRGDPASLRRADEIARALGNAGPVGPGGEDLARLALEGWSGLGARSRWLRLVVLEGQRSGTAEALGAAEDLARSPASGADAASLRFQALRTLAALPGRAPPEIGDLASTWSWAAERDLVGELLALLVALGSTPPESWRAPPAAPAGATPPGRLALVEWWIHAAEASGRATDRAAAARWIREALGDGEESLAQRLRTAASRGAGDVVLAVLASLREGSSSAERAALDRLELCAGVASPERQAELLAAARSAGAGDRTALRTLAALVAGPLGDDAEAELVARAGAPAPDVVDAVVLALDELRRARLDERAEGLEETLRQRPKGGALVRAVRKAADEKADAQRLDLLDRSVERLGP